ncbi:hypothetical protein CHFL109739_14280 [Chryseobacterium flavum]
MKKQFLFYFSTLLLFITSCSEDLNNEVTPENVGKVILQL